MKKLIAIRSAKMNRKNLLATVVRSKELDREYHKLIREIKALDLVIEMGK